MSKNNQRIAVWNKYGHKCAYCGKTIDINDFTIDHVIPVSAGGASSFENYLPCCKSCNMYKADSSLEEWRGKINKLVLQLQKNQAYQYAIKFHQICPTAQPVQFYFETLK